MKRQAKASLKPTRIGLFALAIVLFYRLGYHAAPIAHSAPKEEVGASLPLAPLESLRAEDPPGLSSKSAHIPVSSATTSKETSSKKAASVVPSPPSRPGKFAYAYSIAGCYEDSCMGYVLNSLVATAILRHHNSTSDIVLIVRMNGGIPEERLPPEQEEWIRKSGIMLYYVPKLRTDNFGTATLEKFRILELIQYDRVRFFDADLIPLCNLDREFRDSYEGRLQGFVGKRGTVAPITGSDFIVTPRKGLFARTMNLVHAARNTSGKWDPQTGWGHKFVTGEQWRAGQRSGVKWDFYGASVDQGILYQLMRYEVGSWSDTSRGNVVWQETDETPPFLLGNNTDGFNSSWAPLSNGKWAKKLPSETPEWSRTVCLRYGKYNLYNLHYNGSKKPWRFAITPNKIPPVLDVATIGIQRPYWLHWLGVANRTFDLQLPSRIAPGEGSSGSTTSSATQAKVGNPLGYAGLRDENVLFHRDTDIPRPYLEDLQATKI